MVQDTVRGDQPVNMKTNRAKTSLERIPSKNDDDRTELCSSSTGSYSASKDSGSFRAAKSFQRMVSEMGSNTKFFGQEATALLNDLDSIRNQNRRTQRRIKRLRDVSDDMRGQLQVLAQKTHSGSDLYWSGSSYSSHGRSTESLGRP